MNDAQAQGDVSRLERMMAQYGDSVLRMCCIMLRDGELARDATQDSFLKAFKAMGRLGGMETEKAWLMRIAINTCKDMRRSRWWKFVDRSITPEELPLAAPEAAEDTTIEAVMELPEKNRQVVLLHYYQGMTLEEVAMALHKPPSTVRSTLMRAKDKLRRVLKGWEDDE